MAAKSSTPPRRRRLIGPVLVAVVATVVTLGMVLAPLVMGGGAATSQQSSGSGSAGEAGKDSAPAEPTDQLQQLARREPGDPTAFGDVDAPVVMVAYSDFQCPFCGKFARDTEPTLVTRFVHEGTLRIEWRDFPYLGEESVTAARAARAAGMQDRFWDFHDRLYTDQPAPNSGRWTPDHMVDVAGDLGLDIDRFRKDMKSPLVEKLVRHDFQEGQSIGVTGTPAFLVNGRPIIGAQPTSVFVDAIEQAAKETR